MKRLLAVFMALMLMLCITAFADGSVENEYFDAYTLCYNSTHGGAHEGIQAGWTMDDRAGNLRTSINSEYNMLIDNSKVKSSSLYRDLNYTDSGVVDFSTKFTISVGLDGFEMCFMDDEKNTVYSLVTADGSFCVLQPDGTHRILTTAPANTYVTVSAILDFEKETVRTVIDGVDFGTDALLSDNIMRFAYKTSHEDMVSVIFNGTTKIVANHYIHDDFVFDTAETHTIPYGWTTSDINSGYISVSEGWVKNGATLTRDISKPGGRIADGTLGGKLAFEGYVYVPENVVASFKLMNGENTVADLTLDEQKISSNGATVYDGYLHNFWYRFRLELDLDKHTSVIKINGRKYASAVLPKDFDSIDSLKITATNGGIRFDNLKLFSLVEHDDYVSEPVIPNDSHGNIVGLNICSLWAYTSNHGWACVTPYEDFRPVLGYYDEGNPETADWEIKMMTEHGVDFQAFCWYADKTNEPMKNPRNMLQLHDGYMNARYSDKMKYCIIWEASNGAHPKNIDAFKNYFVPHWIENYFKDERYMTIDNKIVLMCFGYSNFINDMGGSAVAKEAIDYLREEVKKFGYDGLILIASHGGNTASLKNGGVDAVCAYNWGTSGYDLDYSIGRIEGLANGPNWAIPTLSTGFNSLPWHGKRYKNMTPSDFKKGLTYIRDEYFDTYIPKESWQEKLMILSTWNEYGEGTYIMPAEKLHGYGYLEALREVATDADNHTHTDDIPTAAQLARITKNYPQHIRMLRRNDTYEPDLEKTMIVSSEITFEDEEHILTGKVENARFDGGICGTTKSALSYVETRGLLDINGADAKYLKVTMQVSADSNVKVYFAKENELSYYHKKSVTFKATAGDMKEYYVPIGFDLGNVVKIRILPSDTSGVEFKLQRIEVLRNARLLVDEKYIDAAVYPENIDGQMYYPFDPAQAQGYIMGIHFEWDYATKALTLYSATDDAFVKFTAGSNIAESSDGNIRLPIPVYLSDGLPMLHMETVCDVLGMEYRYTENDLLIMTEDYEKNSKFHTRAENEWDFECGSTFGWTVNGDLYNTGDELYVAAIDRDTRMQHTVSFDAYKYSHIEVCIKYEKLVKEKENTTIYFITNNDKEWAENKGKHLYFTNAVVGEYITHTFDMSSVSTWKDTITGLRFDPFNGAGSVAYIKYIKLVPNEEYMAGIGKKYEFTSVTLNAENGKVPFNSENATITVDTDPGNEQNKVYKVTPNTTYGYIAANYDMQFEPGATYAVSVDVMLGSINGDTQTVANVTVHPDPRYDDPAQYNAKNPDDHITLGKTTLKTNTAKWTNISYEFTVNPDSFLRTNLKGGVALTQETFRIYSNPYSNQSVLFYIDNLVITKKTPAKLTVSSATLSNGTLTVEGDSGRVLGADENVLLGVYDADGRMLDMRLVNCSESKTFEESFVNVPKAATVKGFFWTGLRKIIPIDEAVSVTVIK